MEKFTNTVIVGSGHYLPPRVIKNDYFLKSEFYDEKGERIPRTNEDIVQKFQELVGINERRYIEDHMVSSDMGTIAAENAIQDWGGDKEDLDYIIMAHNYGDVKQDIHYSELVPSLSTRVKHKLGIKNRQCIPYDMIFGCPGWVQATIMAHQLIQAKLAKNILVVGGDALSRIYDPCDRDAMIFADGAGAVVMSAVEDNVRYGILSYANVSDSGDESEYLKGGPSLNPNYDGKKRVMIRMAGRKVYEYVLKNVPAAIKAALDQAEVQLEDTSKMLIHQANEKMDEAVFNRLKRLYPACKHLSADFMPMSISFLGNSSVATVPTLFDLVAKKQLSQHEFKKGDNIILASVGAGMNINAIVYRFKK